MGVDINLNAEQRNPTTTDYMAGVMLANGIVWIWAMALSTFSDFFSRIPYLVLALIAYVIYISGATLASYLVCKRTSSKHLKVGLKLAGLAWFFTLIMMLGSTTGPTPALAMILLVCYGAGGMAGGYLALRSELRSRKNVQDGDA